jgi:hypothetical protein
MTGTTMTTPDKSADHDPSLPNLEPLRAAPPKPEAVDPESPARFVPAWARFLAEGAAQLTERLVRAMDRRTEALAKVAAALDRHGVAVSTLKPGPNPVSVQAQMGETINRLVGKPPGTPQPIQMPQGPPPGWSPQNQPRGPDVAPRGRGRPQMTPGQLEARIRNGMALFPAMPPGTFPDSLIYERVGTWGKEYAGATWGQMLTKLESRDFLFWRVRKSVEKEGGQRFTDSPPTAFQWWTWRDRYRDDGLKSLWCLQEKDRLLGLFQAGPPADAPESQEEEWHGGQDDG